MSLSTKTYPATRPRFLTLAVLAFSVLATRQPAMAQEEPAVTQEGLAAAEDRVVFGDWTVRCDQAPNGAVQCALTQAVEAQDRENVWLNAYAFIPADGDGATLLSILVPLRVILTRGLGLRIDNAEMSVFEFVTCSLEGCLASIVLTDELNTALRNGSEALFVIYFEAQLGIGVPISLVGIGAGLDALP
ncbi:MAG: invasion associated locus B family protein [Alphaproteobacteria bacterium]